MLIQSGDIASLSRLPWSAIELGSESQPDEIALNLVRWLVSNLERRSKPFQFLYPVESRDHSVRLLSPYLWIRVMDVRDLAALAASPEQPRGIRGMRSGAILGLMSDAHGDPIPVDDAFVQDLIARARAAADSWSSGIVLGSGVRVLLGTGHGLCGVVEELKNGDALVRIALRTRAVRLRVPVRALRNIGDAPSDYFVKEED